MKQNLQVKHFYLLLLILILLTILLVNQPIHLASANNQTVDQPSELAEALVVSPGQLHTNSVEYTGCVDSFPAINAA
jgi:hypothetical protein